MRRAFGEIIVELGKAHPNLVVVSGDVEQEKQAFRDLFPDRIFNFGLTEQSMISAAAGMATEGLFPVCYSITPFILERPFEQIKIDIDEQNLKVMLVGYSDYPSHGPTHRPLNAKGLCSVFKNIKSYFPETLEETRNAMREAASLPGPSFISLRRAKE